MRFYENIILDKSIKDINSLPKTVIGMLDYYAVCVSCVGNGLMEILSLHSALKPVNDYKDYGILAIVKGKSTANDITVGFIQNWIKSSNDLREFRDYYNNRCK